MIFDLWLSATFPFYAPPVTRDQLGYLDAGPYADKFRAPRFDPAADIAQGGTGKSVTTGIRKDEQ